MNIKEYVLEEFDISQMKQIQEHGMVCGFGNLISYKETVAFHDAHEGDIWDMLYEDAEDMGCGTMELIAQMNGGKYVISMDNLKNLLCWYAIEKTANEILEDLETGRTII
jgi:hypothetical protein